jgi:hypothetical protein
MISYRESQLLDLINKPTEITPDSTKIWRNKKGQFHRENDKPAIEYYNGGKKWYINGLKHRENDKPAVEWSNGRKEWWINGNFIKRNYKDWDTYNDKFFDYSGDEIIGE